MVIFKFIKTLAIFMNISFSQIVITLIILFLAYKKEN